MLIPLQNREFDIADFCLLANLNITLRAALCDTGVRGTKQAGLLLCSISLMECFLKLSWIIRNNVTVFIPRVVVLILVVFRLSVCLFWWHGHVWTRCVRSECFVSRFDAKYQAVLFSLHLSGWLDFLSTISF